MAWYHARICTIISAKLCVIYDQNTPWRSSIPMYACWRWAPPSLLPAWVRKTTSIRGLLSPRVRNSPNFWHIQYDLPAYITLLFPNPQKHTIVCVRLIELKAKQGCWLLVAGCRTRLSTSCYLSSKTKIRARIYASNKIKTIRTAALIEHTKGKEISPA